MTKRLPVRQPYGGDLLNYKHINRLPILDVARKLGFEVRDEKIVCRHSGRHKDESVPFLKVLPSNKVKCDACDDGPMSVLEMVKDYGDLDSLSTAAECIANMFEDVPYKPKGSHLNNPKGLAVPPACDDPLALLIKSGLWAKLPVPVQRLIPVLLDFGTWEDGNWDCLLTISNRAMMTYSGIGTFTSIKPSLLKLEEMGWLEILDSPRGDSPIKGTGRYRITPLSERVRKLADEHAPGFGDDIKAQKAFRKRERQRKQKLWSG